MSIEQRLASDPTVRLFWGFAAVHFVLWLLVCTFTQPNMPLDMVEMLYWGQQWELGYHKHPPLPAWIAASAWWLGGSRDVLMYCVSQLTILATFWAVWQLAREGLSPWAALCSVVLLQGCYYCTFVINDINNTIITRPFWALAVLFLYRALTRDSSAARNRNWLLTGLMIGLGMISKYYIAILVLTMLAIPFLIPRTRPSLKTAGPYLLTAMALLVFSPHFIWMVQNDFITIQYVFRRSGGEDLDSDWQLMKHLLAPIKFLGSQLGAFVPMLVLAWPMLRLGELRKESNPESNLESPSFFHKYVTIIVFGPIAIYVVFSLAMGVSIRSMWGGPLFSFFGVWLFSRFELPSDRKLVNKILRDSVIIGFCMLAALVIRNTVGPGVRGKLSRIHFPGVQASEKINELWRSQIGGEFEFIGGDMFMAGSISAYTPRHVVVYPELAPQDSPWISDQEFSSRGAVIVWEIVDGNQSPPVAWVKRFTKSEILPPVKLKSRAWSGPSDIEIGAMFIPPTTAN